MKNDIKLNKYYIDLKILDSWITYKYDFNLKCLKYNHFVWTLINCLFSKGVLFIFNKYIFFKTAK